MGNPHILVIPYPAQGHVKPLMELSQCLASYGFRITFVNTGDNHERINNASALEGSIPDQVHLVSFPDGQQSVEDWNNAEIVMRVMPGKIEELIDDIYASGSDDISCLIADQTIIGLAFENAVKKGIKRAAFCPTAAAMLVQAFSAPKLIEDGIIDMEGTPTKKQIIKLSPTMPAMKTEHLVWACPGNLNLQKLFFALMARNEQYMKQIDWMLCNSAYELEHGTFDTAPQLLPIGPLLSSNRMEDSVGNFWPADTTCLKWLDQQQPQSVIYIAFGSTTTFEPTQFQELALGLGLTNRPFLWVVRPGITNETNDAFFHELQNQVGFQGKIVTWAPQQKALAHPSVACFVSHCGWNSTIEGVCNGVPFLCWPYVADQFFNQSYICDVWKIGLGFNKDENGIVSREEIKKKVDQLLGNREFKAKAIELGEKVRSSVKEGGSSHQNFKKFVEWVKLG